MTETLYQSSEDLKNLSAWQDFEIKYPFLQDNPDHPISKPKKMTNDTFIGILQERNKLAKNFYLGWLKTITVFYKGVDLANAIQKWQSNVIQNAPIDVEIEVASVLNENIKEQKIAEHLRDPIKIVAKNFVLDLQKQWQNLILESPNYEGFEIIETVAPTKKEKNGSFTKLEPSEKKLKTLAVHLRADVTKGSNSYNLLRGLANSPSWIEPINKIIAELVKIAPSEHKIKLEEYLNVLDILEDSSRKEFKLAVKQDPKMLENFKNFFQSIINEFSNETLSDIASKIWVYEQDTRVTSKESKSGNTISGYIDHIAQVFIESQKLALDETESKQIQEYRDQLDRIISREVDLPVPSDQKVDSYIVTNITWIDTRNIKSLDQLTVKDIETWAKDINLDTKKYDAKTTVILTVIPELKNGEKLEPMNIPLELVQMKSKGYILTQPFFPGGVFPQTNFSDNLKLILQSIRYIMHEKEWLPDSPWIIFQKWFVNVYEPRLEIGDENIDIGSDVDVESDNENNESEIDLEEYESDEREFEKQQRAKDKEFIEPVEIEELKFCSFYIKEIVSKPKSGKKVTS